MQTPFARRLLPTNILTFFTKWNLCFHLVHTAVISNDAYHSLSTHNQHLLQQFSCWTSSLKGQQPTFLRKTQGVKTFIAAVLSKYILELYKLSCELPSCFSSLLFPPLFNLNLNIMQNVSAAYIIQADHICHKILQVGLFNGLYVCARNII